MIIRHELQRNRHFLREETVTTIALNALVLKFAKDRCPECLIWAMSLSSSLTDSTNALLRSIILLGTDFSEFPLVVLDFCDKLTIQRLQVHKSYHPLQHLRAAPQAGRRHQSMCSRVLKQATVAASPVYFPLSSLSLQVWQ